MSYLVDTNVLLWRAQRSSAHHTLAKTAISSLRQRGESLYIAPQNILEFWNAATRPVYANGLGYTPQEALRRIRPLERLFQCAPDAPDIYREWKYLAQQVGFSGKQVHDARLVAVMRVYGITHILTFNTADFSRYPGITVVHPQNV
jgi:predicted nucleic acid-binding protein